MEQQFNQEVLQKLKRKKRQNIWRRILSLMMCIVVFCTTYMLILPAITKQTDTFCGIEEHIHQESCYEDALLCLDHVHGDLCYTLTENLICTEPAEPMHIHTDGCFEAQPVLICAEEESEEHSHAEGCYEIQAVLICTESTEPVHTHTDGCYEVVQQLTCSLENTPEHVHTESCHGKRLICTLGEHTHGLLCYSDPTADVESEATWKASLPELTGVYADDVLAIAKSQIGYRESTRNYTVSETGDLQGYTRYGDWYGFPYGEWCAMFVSFCLHYAEVEGMPIDASCPNWAEELREMELFLIPSEYIPAGGDLIFFDWEQDGSIDHVGLVEALEEFSVLTIEGNRGGSVIRNKYELHDDAIAGYGMLIDEPTPEIPTGGTFAPEDTDAWAELVPDTEPAETEPEETTEAEEPVVFTSWTPRTTLASPFSLRRSSTYAVPRAGTPLDLTPYINAVSMYDAAGNYIPSGSTVTEGDMIEFRIDYTINGQQLAYLNGETITVNSNTLTYQIPKTFQVVKDSEGNIYNSLKQVVGTYAIDSATGQIYMTFNDEFVEQNANGNAISGKVSFYSTVVKITDEDGEHQDYKFTDEITLGIVIEEKVEAVGDLQIEKEKVEVSGQDLYYRITVTSKEGTNGSVTVTDKMSTGLYFAEGIEVRNKQGRLVSGVQFSPSGDRSSFTMTLPEMAAGDSYTIRYRCTTDMNLLGSDMTVRNTATVKGKDSHDNELEDEVTVDHTFQMLDKVGKLNDDGSITWSVTINQAKVNISGWVLEDIISTAAGSVPYHGPVTITDQNGSVVARNVALPYTFPNGSNKTYFITYTTTHDLSAGENIYNKAILKNGTSEVTEVTGVEVGTPISKSGVAGEPFQDTDGTYILPVTWTVTIDTTAGPIPADRFFYDRLEGYPASDSYMTYTQLMAALDNIRAELQRVTGQGVENFYATVLAPGADRQGDTYSLQQLQNNTNNCQSFKFERFRVELAAEVPRGNILTFQYEVNGLFPNNILSSTAIANRFSISGEYEVEGRVHYSGGAINLTKYAIESYNPDNPNYPDWFWSDIDWGSTDGIGRYDYSQLYKDYLAWAIELSVPPNFLGGDMTVIEDLPDGVTIKGFEMIFNSECPVGKLSLTELVPGQTYPIVITILPADQYGQWRPQGAQDVTLTVTVTEEGDLEIVLPGAFLRNLAQLAIRDSADEWFGHFYIYTQIDEDYNWTPTEEGSFVYLDHFQNRYTVINEFGDVIDIGSQDQIIRKDESKTMIRKDVKVQDDILNYSVLLNSYGRDLVPNSGTIQILDTLTYTSTPNQELRLRLIAGTVKLYEAVRDSSGNYVKGQQLNVSYLYNETPVESGENVNWIHTLELDVPDGKRLILEYSYGATGAENAVHQVRNVCSIEGAGTGSLEGDHKLELEVKDSVAEADIDGIVIYKVDANNNGLYLQNAKFRIYIWNEEQQQYIPVHHPNNGDDIFTTNQLGVIALDGNTVNPDQFSYNTAYYIQEVESPGGYFLGPEKFYFYIVHKNLQLHPECMPPNFHSLGQALARGDVIYRENVSEFTRIRVEKYWLNHKGDPITVTNSRVSAITLELWQKLEGVSGSDTLYGTYTITPDADGNWSLVIEDLPKATKNADGTKGTNYLYYIKEAEVGGFLLDAAENNAGINTGTIKLTNRELEGYTLPETGGAGTHLYATAGLLLMLASAAYLVYIFTHRRREAQRSS